MKKILFSSVLGVLFLNASALTYELPKKGNDIVGQVQIIKVGRSNRVDIAQRYDMGFYELVEANPGININRLRSSQQIVIPSRFILPSAPHAGMVINLAEMRMYFYPKGTGEVITLPVGIGREGWATPLGKTKIIAKARDPYWRPTQAVREDFLKRYGYPLPELMGPGPENPLGQYAIRLAWPSYLIHGTNSPDGVGQRVSAGCIRMFNEDVGSIFDYLHNGTQVNVVYQPYKAAWDGKTLYLEAHIPIVQRPTVNYRDVIRQAEKEYAGKNVNINWQKAKQVVELSLGVPQPIGYIASGLSHSATNKVERVETAN